MKTIRALRRERGWTQFELALMVGVQPQTVYLWEHGRRTPMVPQLRKLGEIFGMCSDEIDLAPVAGMTEQEPTPSHAHRGDDVPRAPRHERQRTPMLAEATSERDRDA